MLDTARASPGTLYLVPNLLGVSPPEGVLPARTLALARRLTHWAVETPKAARAFLKSLDLPRAIGELAISTLSDADSAATATALDALRAGHDVGLLSDAGCPGVADPGATLVAAAHAHGVRVVPLVGPSAILLALMASGLGGQQFCFHGYLPVKPEARAHRLRLIEQQSRHDRRTEVWIETPYRNAVMLRTMITTLAASTRVCVAADLTLANEAIECRPVGRWRAEDAQRFERRPAIFLMRA